MNNTYYIGFDASAAKDCGLVVFHRGRIIKVDDVGKHYLESWCCDLRRELGATAHVIARVEMPTQSTMLEIGHTMPPKGWLKFGWNCGMCHVVADMFADICRRGHIRFEVEIVPSNHRIRCDKGALATAKTKTQLLLGLEAARGRKYKTGKTSETNPSKWTRGQAMLLFPDLKDFKTNGETLDAVGLLYKQVVR